MFKLIQSPIQKPLNNVVFNGCQIPRPTYPRYSSVEDFNSRQDPNVSLLRFDLKPQKRGTTMQKSERSENQRSHSQRKLTLITVQPQNSSFNSSLSTSQNINFASPRQAYEGYKNSSQLKTLNSSRNAPLQKRSKPTTTKYNYQQRFPTSTSNLRIECDPVSQQQNENDEDKTLSFVKFQKQKNNKTGGLDENNNYLPMSTQNCFGPMIQTVTHSPVYEPSLRKENSSQSNQTINNNSVLQYCHQKISQLTYQTQSILMENSKKIKELESLLVLNKQKIEEKDQIIRQLELNLVLNETLKHQPFSHFTQNHFDSPRHFRGNSMDCRINQSTLRKNHEEFLDSRVNDLEKKIQVISKWFQISQQKINQKIDKVNNFMQRFVAVKFHNMKVTLRTFVTKNQQKVNSIIDAITRVENIVKQNQIDEYERIMLKTKQFASTIQKFSEIKVPEKIQFDDMKTTMNTTAIGICKHRPTLSDYQNMVESREINESFWNNFEDFSQSKNGEQSFTDDSFSYAPGIDHNNTSPSSNSNSSSLVNDFPVKQFPSFSRKVSNDSFQSKRSPLVQIEFGCIKTIDQISKCRHGPLSVYLDPSGNMRYKSSQSYIFDRRGNILKPTPQQIDYCLKMGWITMD